MNRTRLALMMTGVVVIAAAFWFPRAPSPSKDPNRLSRIKLRAGLEPEDRMTAHLPTGDLAKAARMYAELTGLEPWPEQRKIVERLDDWCDGRLLRLGLYTPTPRRDTGMSLHRDGLRMAVEVKEELENLFAQAGLHPVRKGRRHFELLPTQSQTRP